MKRKDYVRLSKISLKSRKKTTRATVRGISFGMILLMPLLFIVIAFHVDLNNVVNEYAYIRTFTINYNNEKTEEEYVDSMYKGYSEKIYELEDVENIVKYNQYLFNNETYDSNNELSPRMSFVIDNVKKDMDYYFENPRKIKNGYETEGLYVIDTSVGNNIFLNSDVETLGGESPIIKGSSFSKRNSKGEIIVSSNFIKHYDLSSNIVGETITLNYTMTRVSSKAPTYSKDTISGEFYKYEDMPVTILRNFEIVGIYDSDIYNSEIRKGSDYNYHQYENYFWITTDSLYDNQDNCYLPETLSVLEQSGNDSYPRTVFYYPQDVNDMANNANSKNMAFIPLGLGADHDSYDNFAYTTIVEFKSYKAATEAKQEIEELYKKSSNSIEDINTTTQYMTDTFENYSMFYTIFTYITIVLAIFGGIIFFATLLNLYNTVHYSVQSRRNYLGMIRAIGMKGQDVRKLYLIEITQIFKRSYIWSTIFGGGICIGLCVAFKSIMNTDAAEIIAMDLSLNPIYILVSLGVLVIVNTIIAIAYSMIACHEVANKPILDVLVENR